MDLNKVTLIGRLTAKPESVREASGQQSARFVLVTNYIWKDFKTKEKKETSESHQVVTWGKLAEICLTYLDKQSRVYVEGRLNKNGDIMADEIIMLGHKR